MQTTAPLSLTDNFYITQNVMKPVKCFEIKANGWRIMRLCNLLQIFPVEKSFITHFLLEMIKF